jgi:hypothetical protein
MTNRSAEASLEGVVVVTMVSENSRRDVEKEGGEQRPAIGASEELAVVRGKFPTGSSVPYFGAFYRGEVRGSQEHSSTKICIESSGVGDIDTHRLEGEQQLEEPAVESEAADDVWKQKYASLLRDYNAQHDEVEDLWEEVEDAKYFLGKTKVKRREMKVANHALEKEVAAMRDDRDKLFEECLMMKALLTSRDQDIESLVAQVNLLIQVGTITRSDSRQDSKESTNASQSRDIRGAGKIRGLSAFFSPRGASKDSNKDDKPQKRNSGRSARSVLSFGAPNAGW